MLRITVSNIDVSYHGIFDTDNVDVAVEQALAYLKAKCGFFQQNVFYRCDVEDAGGVNDIGILLCPADEIDVNNGDELDYKLNQDDTYCVGVSRIEFGTMFT